METAQRPGWRFAAYGAAFGDVTRALKERGYRWDADARVWSREVSHDRLETETSWLTENVYAPGLQAKSDKPFVEPVDWTVRHI
jgi:DNA polymerase-3 subunit epsilon